MRKGIRKRLFLLAILAVWVAMHAYLFLRMCVALDLTAAGRSYLAVGLGVLCAWFPLTSFPGTTLRFRHASLVRAPGIVWVGVVALIMAGLIALDLVLVPVLCLLEEVGWVGPRGPQWLAQWGVFAVLVASGVLSLWGVYRALAGPWTTELEISLPDLPERLDGFTIALASDVHIGGLVGPRCVARVVESLRAMDPDVVALLGDLTDTKNGGDGVLLARLAGVPTRHGVFCVSGNHELFSGGVALLERYEELGMRVLRQQHVVIDDGLVLAGVDDPFLLGHRSAAPAAIDEALRGRPKDLPVVLLSHQPLALDHAAGAGVDLMLCGHTHGGQLPPFHFLSRLMYGVLAGRRQIGGMQLYVNRGVGFWGPPIRVFADPEVVRIRLHAGPLGATLPARVAPVPTAG